MFDLTAEASGMQRARGRAAVALSSSGRVAELAQAGCAKAFLPRIPSSVPEVVYLNTAGGLTGGDRLSFSLTVADHSAAVGTTQTAERAYASSGGHADVDVALRVGAHARLDWLPQETILFDRSTLKRRTKADLGAGAIFMGLEVLVLGRAAMGETVNAVDLFDSREVWREGKPVVLDPVQLTSGATAWRVQRCIRKVAPTSTVISTSAARYKSVLPR